MKGQKLLVVLDMDSTFIREEVIDLLAAHAGVGHDVAAITERSMRGELDFRDSLRERVALLKGLREEIFDQVRDEITLSIGAQRMVEVLHQNGHIVAVVSGGFENIIAPFLRSVGVDYFKANILEVQDGVLTGHMQGPVIDRDAKANYLQELSAALNIPLTQTVVVGDGANDLGMMAIAGLSVAFNAKPVVIQAAKASITDGDLSGVLELIGIAKEEIDKFPL